MALVEKRVCDVFGVTKDVSHYRVTIDQCNEVGPVDWATESCQEIDLCPRALKRLQHFIARGVTPPKTKKKAEAPA